MDELFPGNEPALYVLEPDFFRDGPEDRDQLHYFEGCGCDNAALLVDGSTGYLLDGWAALTAANGLNTYNQ